MVAVSGGPDSVALLDLLLRTRDVHQLELVVAHLDHGIHQAASGVAEEVRALAQAQGLPCELERLELGPEATETEARARRYAWLEAVRLRLHAQVIITAHHADDQVETVLMRVLAGSGPAGLAGMAPVRGNVVRPLLQFRRAELAEYLAERGLPAWTDPANADSRHLRSWLRADVLPRLRARVPDLDRNLLRLAEHAAVDRAAWDAVLDALPGIDLQHEADAISVAAPIVAGYHSPLAEAIVLALARRLGRPIGRARVQRVLQLLASGSSGARVPLGSDLVAELSFGRLRLTELGPAVEIGPLALEGQRGEQTWGRWRFRWQPAPAPERQGRADLHAWFIPPSAPLSVRSWRPGERLRPLGGSGRRLLVRCFQDARVPSSLRASWPVLTLKDDVVWVPGVCRSDARIPLRGTEALRVDAEYA